MLLMYVLAHTCTCRSATGTGTGVQPGPVRRANALKTPGGNYLKYKKMFRDSDKELRDFTMKPMI